MGIADDEATTTRSNEYKHNDDVVVVFDAVEAGNGDGDGVGDGDGDGGGAGNGVEAGVTLTLTATNLASQGQTAKRTDGQRDRGLGERPTETDRQRRLSHDVARCLGPSVNL